MEIEKNQFEIQGRLINESQPTYFIADVAANHDGDLNRAKDLIHLAKEAGADAVKFQHFQAETIVSDYGFRNLGDQQAHQKKWQKSVFEVYKDASVDLGWTTFLKKECDDIGITFFTSPYSIELVDQVDPYVSAFKIGSGDITWHEIIEYIASQQKPYIIATGASTIEEVVAAVELGMSVNPKMALLQCNTNYTGELENFKYIQLNVIKSFQKMFPQLVLGLSDHTPGHATVLGAVALGARIIEKHFTDNTGRVGPDHCFSMDPLTWKEMVDRTRELELALGDSIKKVEDNERQTVVLQRRSLRLKNKITKGHILSPTDLIALRPCPTDAIPPNEIGEAVGKKVLNDKEAGDYLTQSDLEI